MGRSAHKPAEYPANLGHGIGRAAEEKVRLKIMVFDIYGRSLIKMYPCFGICTDDSCDRPHAISLGNEAKTGYDCGFGEGRHLSRSQLLHLTLGEVTSKSQ